MADKLIDVSPTIKLISSSRRSDIGGVARLDAEKNEKEKEEELIKQGN